MIETLPVDDAKGLMYNWILRLDGHALMTEHRLDTSSDPLTGLCYRLDAFVEKPDFQQDDEFLFVLLYGLQRGLKWSSGADDKPWLHAFCRLFLHLAHRPFPDRFREAPDDIEWKRTFHTRCGVLLEDGWSPFVRRVQELFDAGWDEGLDDHL